LKSMLETTILNTAETSITPTPQLTYAMGSGCRIFFAASKIIQPAARKMSRASTVPEMFSILPWPKGCRLSAGTEDVLTENMAMRAATRSTAEWIASEMIDTAPIKNPTASFRMTSRLLETTDSRATFSFCCCVLSMKRI